MSRKVCIAGGAVTPFDYPMHITPEGMIANAIVETQEDVPDFHLTDLEFMVYSHFSVHFGKQLCPEWIVHDHLGLVGLPHVRIENGGNTGGSALYGAFLAVKSGLFDVVGVAGWETMDNVTQSQGSEFIALASDTRYEALAGGIYPIYYAAMAYKFMKEHDLTEEDFALAALKNRNYAADNPKTQWYRGEYKKYKRDLTVDDIMESRLISYPLKRYDCCLMSRGGAFALVTSEEWAKKHAPNNYVVIDGAGLSSCTIRAGDRLAFPNWDKMYGKGYPDMTEFAACRRSGEVAYDMAGIEYKRAKKEIDVAEIHDAFSSSEVQIYKALHWCDSDDMKEFIREKQTFMEGEVPTNVGGGLMGYGHPVGATGIMSAIECMYHLNDTVPKKHLSSKTYVKDAQTGLVNSHAGTGTSISNFILRRP
ncbi:MAG: thiolase domain-containing protein [Candidatus Lokiarchaeota archaeon]|nr:thiolase domain-containing protein [Candidatus Lokiarchaeota archaeon]